MKTISTLPCQYEEIDLTINYDIKRRLLPSRRHLGPSLWRKAGYRMGKELGEE